MKIYMIYDYGEESIVDNGYLNPMCFSSFEKAEEYLTEYMLECGILKSIKQKKGRTTYTFFEKEDRYKIMFDIFEVEVK